MAINRLSNVLRTFVIYAVDNAEHKVVAVNFECSFGFKIVKNGNIESRNFGMFSSSRYYCRLKESNSR